MGRLLQESLSHPGETRWQELARRFQRLGDITGREKSTSYVLNVIYEPVNMESPTGPNNPIEFSVELGCYDVPGWPRHIYLGPYPTEAEALTATEKKILEAEEIIKKELAERGGDWDKINE